MRLPDPGSELKERAGVPWPETGDLEWVLLLKHSLIIGNATLSKKHNPELHAFLRLTKHVCTWFCGISRLSQIDHTGGFDGRDLMRMGKQLVQSRTLSTASFVRRARSTANTVMIFARSLRVCPGSGVIKVASRRFQNGSCRREFRGRPELPGAEPRIIAQRHAVWNSGLPILIRYKWNRG